MSAMKRCDECLATYYASDDENPRDARFTGEDCEQEDCDGRLVFEVN